MCSRTDGGDGGDDLPQLELVQDGGLPGGVQPHHEDPHLLLADQTLQQVPKEVPHGQHNAHTGSTGRVLCCDGPEGTGRAEEQDQSETSSDNVYSDMNGVTT